MRGPMRSYRERESQFLWKPFVFQIQVLRKNSRSKQKSRIEIELRNRHGCFFFLSPLLPNSPPLIPPPQRRGHRTPCAGDWSLSIARREERWRSIRLGDCRAREREGEAHMPQVQSTPATATAAGMSAASAPAPRRWEGVDQALERMVLRACLDQAPERRRVREAFKDVQLSIDHCLFKGQYSDIGTKESYEQNSRGVEIFSKCWYPENHRMKAIVCVCHGIARKIASAGYGVFALDYPGFGLSEGLHGYIPSFDTLVDDATEHFTKIKENPEHRGLPSFLFGQSMGGAVALKIHFKQPNKWDGAILVAPMCKMMWFRLGLFSKS
uniref:Serine aminopeptidase S33 domain-containing protein n=1 Tax=Leersia perrieri TaxID=77586 RepID=A0A0D9XHM0_9ORYZ